MKSDPKVYVVDDDDQVRSSLRWLLESVGLHVETIASGDAFLKVYDPNRPGCLLLDVRMPGMSGLDLQEHLTSQGIDTPIIVMTGFADVPMAVRALKAGAVEFIEKPFNDQVLLEHIYKAIEKDAKRRERSLRHAEVVKCIADLTPREREVMDLVVSGKANKQIARQLGVSHKTVEVHRAHVMKKMAAESLAELVQLAMKAPVK